jgi:hypothetical protein
MTEADRLHTRFLYGVDAEGPVAERCYTLTHSDRTGDLFLSIGSHYDDDALQSLQVRLERDEVLAQWARTDRGWTLELHMMAQGGLPLFGTGSMRRDIFRHYRPLVLRAIGRGDREFLEAHEELAEAPVIACFHWRRGRTECESWGRLADWR